MCSIARTVWTHLNEFRSVHFAYNIELMTGNVALGTHLKARRKVVIHVIVTFLWPKISLFVSSTNQLPERPPPCPRATTSHLKTSLSVSAATQKKMERTE